ncbi:hypothetical protein [Amnibacterium sp.]|uniref:hypothetical protein n=1 Tax=Amnibacterium sp. TaxID=1872496 RepID=UPI00261861D9|nr:hypothetical protein [Amnibacterium sp.]MCU1473684.1 hypothetical protein [Amnibacterium sp.]
MSTIAPRARGRRAALALVLTGVCLGTAGCSQAYSASGRLAQAASDASAQTQTGALTLRLSATHRLPSPATDTALSDAIDKLGQDDSSLTSADVSGGLETARTRILSKVRTGEDLLARARHLTEAGAGQATTDALVRQLQVTAKQLAALQKQLQGSG